MMNSMKKIISVILALTLVFSMFALAYAEDTGATTQAAKYAKEIDVIKAMGIINGDETGAFNADSNLTRAEFAQVLTVLLKINYGDVAKENAWYYNFETEDDLDNVLLTPQGGLVTGEETSSSAPVTVEKVQKFDDVPTSHWAFGVISQITDIGYMIGTSATEFSPEDPVTVNQVNKVLVKILGYEQFANQNGGYPAGFNYLASTLKVLKDVNNYGENPITRGELAKMLYNMFGVNMIAAVSVTDTGVATYTTSEETFLNDVLGVYKYEGKLTDNGTTAVVGSSSVGDDEIKIGNVTFKLSEKADYARSFIGRVIEFYVVEEEDTGRRMIIHAALAEDGEDFVVDIDNFEDLTNGSLVYIDEDEQEEELDVSNIPTIILNGSKVEGVTKEEIKAFSNGTVTALKSGTGDIYDTIVIEGFVSMYVKNVIASEMIVSNGLVEPGDEYANLDLKPENNRNREITIIKNGANATFGDIKSGMVIDVAKSENAIKIVISDKKEKITVSGTSVDEDSDSYIYSSEGEEYLLAKKLVTSETVKVPDLGTEATAYFNTFGEIVYFDSSSTTLEGLGILVKAVADGRGLKKDYIARIFTETGAFVNYSLAEKVAFTNENDAYSKEEAVDIIDILENYKDSLITFTTTEEGIISEITVPLSIAHQDTRASGKLGMFYSADDELYLQQGFGGKAFTRNSPKLFFISTGDVTDEYSKYQIKTTSVLMNDMEYGNVTAYNTDPKSYNAKYVVMKNDKLTNYTPSVRTMPFVVVESVKQALNADGEHIVRIEGVELAAASGGVQTRVTYESSTGVFDNMKAFANNGKDTPSYSVKSGDIINLHQVNGNVIYASLIYRQSLNYANNPRKMGGALAGQESGLYDAVKGGNPYTVKENSGIQVQDPETGAVVNAPGEGAPTKIPGKSVRMFDGFPVRINEGLIAITNMDLSDSSKVYKETDDSQVTNIWAIPSTITVMDVKGEKVSVRAGSTSDIKTYEDYGASCSRLFIHDYQGIAYKLVVINVDR